MRPSLLWLFLLICPLPSARVHAATASEACASVGPTHLVWRAINAQYLRLADALRRKDMAALESLYSPTVGAVTPGGEVWSRDRALAYQRNGLALVERTQHIGNTILHLRVCGSTARATVLQRWERDQRMAGAVRHMETATFQDENWSLERDGWKRGMIENVMEGVAFIDGKRFNPATASDGYDPEAPEYDPGNPNPRRPVLDALLPIATERGAEAAIAASREMGRSSAYYLSEAQFNTLGYRLLGMHRSADAVRIFEFNTERYPRSANAYDSLGEAYMAAGQTARAIAAYETSLRLNPRNGNAVSQLRILRSRH